MPAPAAKFLWNEMSESQWKGLHASWLMQWDGLPLLQNEFYHVMPGVFIDRRMQMWLEDTDELGMLLVAIRKHIVLMFGNSLLTFVFSEYYG